eukprot:TRINITY_DN23713_c0_g1_i1.p1 TRINITY_DN23713_c0_g1~~TRINITY_DN23713_c0_g1_i1.p1  ORF type:complete len:149 (-),score=1.27 TRINITY_DN23713_c0_g1_i1:171-617(-)
MERSVSQTHQFLTITLFALVILAGTQAPLAQLREPNSLHARSITVGVRTVSPWTYGVRTEWSPPKVFAGDTLVFRWADTKRHNVVKASAVSFATCRFWRPKVLKSAAYAGYYSYTVKSSEAGLTLFFASSAGSDCSRDMRVSIPVSLF